MRGKAMYSLRIHRPPLLWATKTLQLFIYYTGKLFFSFARVEVRGASHIRGYNGVAVFAANHANTFDPAIVCLALDAVDGLHKRLPLIFVARGQKFYDDMGFIIFTLSRYFPFLGAYPVTPQNARPIEDPRKHNLLATHIAFLKKGYSVLIFPEGATTRTGKLLPPQRGVAILSGEGRRPIIPIAIEGTFGLSFTDFLFGIKRVRVTFGEPIPPLDTAALHPDFSSRKRAYEEGARLVMWRISVMLRAGKDEKEKSGRP